MLTQIAQPAETDFGRFFNHIALSAGIDDYSRNAEAVSIMTMHAVKGMAFKAVFIAGCEDGLIPFELYGKKSDTALPVFSPCGRKTDEFRKTRREKNR